ncbi:hypothetical protein NUACC21_70360 [Scytonema sp. NUACC21]
MSKARRKLLLNYGVAVLVSLLALLIRWILHPLLGENAPLLVLLMAVIVSAWYGGFGSGLLVTILSGILGTYFFVQPTFSLKVLGLSNAVRVGIFLVEGVLISWLNEALKIAKQRAELTALTLKESEESYRLLVEGVKDYAIFMLDPNGYITSWNTGAEGIFRVFERLHGSDTYPGTGIGLAIVRKGVERMGGQVGIISQIGHGSRFWVELLQANN